MQSESQKSRYLVFFLFDRIMITHHSVQIHVKSKSEGLQQASQ